MDHTDLEPDTLILRRGMESVEQADAVIDSGFSERYVLRELLGRGGMGVVYRCLDLRIRREIAMKIADTSGEASHGRQRFLREAKIQGQLEHPAIPPLYDIGVDPSGAEFFTMKRVAGITLEAVLRGRARRDPEVMARFSRSKLLATFRRVCRGIEFAHAVGVAHRDLKPANVMLGEYGEVYILDWGVAKVIEHDGPIGALGGQTMAGQMLGTPGYAAPEQLVSAAAADERSDIYALGAILFEILSLEPLHPGPSETEKVRATQVGAQSAKIPERLRAHDVPAELHAMCIRATALDPDERYPSVGALLADLEGILDADADQERLKSLAARHVETADAIAQRLVTSPDDEGERTRALEELGRALALDPQSENAGRVLRKLLGTKPKRLPLEAETALQEAQEEDARNAARSGVFTYAAYLLVGVLVIWAGMRSFTGLLLISIPLLVAIGLCAYIGFRTPPRPRLVLAIFLASSAAMVFATGLFGALILVPAMATVNLLAFNRGIVRRYRLPMLIVACATVFVPFCAEWAGLIAPAYDFSNGFLRVLPNVMSFPELPTRLGLLVAGVVAILAPIYLLWPAQDAAARARQNVHLQVWQVSRLVPEHMNLMTRARNSGAPRS